MKTEEKKRRPWSKWGFWLALALFIISFGWGIYQTYFYKQKPNLVVDILTNEELLNLKEPIDNLKILYKDIDLKQQKKNVTILTFRISNNGNGDITSNLYDENTPLGFVIKQGNLVISPTVINASDMNYFRNYIRYNTNDTIILNNKIIESGKYIDFKCIILNKSGEKPLLAVIGKIAGIDNIKVIQEKLNNGKNSNDFILNVVAGITSVISVVTLILTTLMSKDVILGIRHRRRMKVFAAHRLNIGRKRTPTSNV